MARRARHSPNVYVVTLCVSVIYDSCFGYTHGRDGPQRQPEQLFAPARRQSAGTMRADSGGKLEVSVAL